MFNNSFYPTPIHLIEKLLEPYKIERDTFSAHKTYYKITGNVLEPNAGKCDIVQFVEEVGNCKIFCIEVEPDLQEIIKSKGFPVIHNDFLTYQKDMYFDFIFMNPPFENGDLHLLKAIEISTNTKIACILNAETIKNPFSNNRKLLLECINKYNGKIEFVKDAFTDAERKTNVEVALVWLEINKKEHKFDFEFISDDEIENTFDFNFSEFELAKNDVINNLKIRSEKLKLALVDKIKADKKFEYYFKQLTEDKYVNPKDWIIKDDNPEAIYSYFSLKCKKFLWNYILKYLDIKEYMSSNMINDFDSYISEQSNLSFNKENVFSFFSMIMHNKHSIMQKMIEEVFDYLTSHSYQSNRLYIEKWKTNSAYKINRKIIAPTNVSYGSYCSADDLKRFGSNFSLSYSDWHRSYLCDLDKVLCVIAGENRKNIISIAEALESQFSKIGRIKTGDDFENVCNSTFFKIKFFKKGTVHLEFKDIELWKEFNYRACKGKNWLPQDELKENRKYKEKSMQNILNFDKYD